MANSTTKLLDFAIARSFKVKSVILFIGAAMILFGSELRRTDPTLGLAVYFAGLLVDWGIIYLVYVEITGIQNETEDISERAFDRASRVRPPFDTLESKVDDLEEEVGTRIGGGGRRLVDRVDKLESDVDDIKRSLGMSRF